MADPAFPALTFRELGYDAVHHGEGRWNGVAILSRVGLDDVRAGWDDGGEDDPEARLLWATCGGVRVGCVYVPNGRSLDDPHYAYKLRWLERLRATLDAHEDPVADLVVLGDFNIAPDDRDVWDPARVRRGHPRQRARAGGAAPARGVGPRGRLPPPLRRRRALLLVGLPRWRLPQGPRHAHRPGAGHRGRWPSGLAAVRDRPQRPQGQAAERPRPGGRGLRPMSEPRRRRVPEGGGRDPTGPTTDRTLAPSLVLDPLRRLVARAPTSSSPTSGAPPAGRPRRSGPSSSASPAPAPTLRAARPGRPTEVRSVTEAAPRGTAGEDGMAEASLVVDHANRLDRAQPLRRAGQPGRAAAAPRPRRRRHRGDGHLRRDLRGATGVRPRRLHRRASSTRRWGRPSRSRGGPG